MNSSPILRHDFSAPMSRARSRWVRCSLATLTSVAVMLMPLPFAAAAAPPDPKSESEASRQAAAWPAPPVLAPELPPGSSRESRPSADAKKPRTKTPRKPGKKTDAYSSTEFRADGTATARIHRDPAFRRDPSGEWVAVDPTLRAAPDRTFPLQAAGAVRPLMLGSTAEQLVRVELDDGPVDLAAIDLTIGEPSLDDDGVVRYQDVAPDTDLEYTSTAAGLKEDIVLRGPAAPTSFRFHLSDPSAQLGMPERQPDGGYTFPESIAEGVQLGLAAPRAYVKPREGEVPDAGIGTASMSVEPVEGGFDITVSVDREWYDQQTSPVILDPTITFGPAGGTVADVDFPTSGTACGGGPCGVNQDGFLRVGTFGGLTWRGAVRFDLSAIPAGSNVTSANYHHVLYGCSSLGSCPTQQLEIRRIDGAWTTASSGQQVAAATGATVVASGPNAGTDYDLRAQTQRWVDRTDANHGISLQLASESAATEGTAYYSSRGPGRPDELPQLTVDFSTGPPDPPTNVRAVAKDSSADLTWDAPLHTGGMPVDYYYIYTSDASDYSIVRADVAYSTSTTIGGLTNGRSYYFTVYAHTQHDSYGYSDPSAASNVVTPVRLLRPPAQPGAPQASAGNAEANVRFEPPSVDANGITGYQITASPGGRTADAGRDARSAAVTGLTNGTTYTFTVRARSDAGDSPESPPSNAVTPSSAVSSAPGDATSAEVVEPAPMTMPPPGTGTMPTLTDGPRRVVPGAASETLGLEDWQSYRGTDLGGQGQAHVNVANGNLVAQYLDSTPVQAHGRLSYVLRRTYNSQQSVPLLPHSGGIGAGWTLNLGEEAGDFTTVGLAGDALLAAANGDLEDLTPGQVTLIDRDGTAHSFVPKPLGTAITSPLLSEVAAGQVEQFARRALTGSTGAIVCVDTAYTSPQGVHASLVRYLQVGSGTACPSSGAAAPEDAIVLGYALIRPDRVRVEYAVTGQVVSMTDAAGVELRYAYETELAPGVPLGRLAAVYEPRGCDYTRPTPAQPGTLPPGCRAFTLDYSEPNTVKVTDPARRVTSYRLTAPAEASGPQYLHRVDNPDGSALIYRYDGVPGPGSQPAPDCGPATGALCSVADARGKTTSFTYADDGELLTLDKAKAVSVVDRRGLRTLLSYGTSMTTATTGTAGKARKVVYAGIDTAGRVSRVLEGDTAGVLYRDTRTTWDHDGATCSQPAARIDHNACAFERAQTSSQDGAAPAQRTTSTFNKQGMPLIVRRANGTGGFDITTAGFRTQHVRASGTAVYDDAIIGGGNVNSGAQRADGAADPTLFTVTDRVETLTARGNAAADWQKYRTAFDVDAEATQRAGGAPEGGVCSGGPRSNTGLLCASTAPAFDSTGKPAVTRYTYDSFGQRTTMTTPKAVAETASGQVPAAYRYEYLTDSERDLTGAVSAGGWLRAVIDPTGAFVAYGYDRAGNVVRTWDRNATAGRTPAQFPGPLATPPTTRYSEQLYGPTSAGRDVAPPERLAALEKPWRFLRSDRDPLGNRTLFGTDANGNVTSTTSPRGTQSVAAGQPAPAGNTTVSSYDDGDLQTSTTLPANRQVNGSDRDRPSTTGYDEHGQPTLRSDPRGVNTAFDHDNAGRLLATTYSRGPASGAGSAPAPRACRTSTASDAPRFGSGVVLCATRTVYDGLDQPFAASDGNGQITTVGFDALGRQVSAVSPRGGATVSQPLSTVRTEVRYDADGQPVTVCRPRQFTEGTGGCTSTARYATHADYDVSGRPSVTRTYRDGGSSAPLETRTRYDADGNPVAVTNARNKTTTAVFNLLGRQTSLTRPRSAGVTHRTTYGYDKVGNRTFVRIPTTGTGTRTEAYGYDALNRLVDTVTGASSTSAASAGVLSADGGGNTRTRTLFDADGNHVGTYGPRAFATSVTSPDARFLTRSDVDANGRPTVSYTPRSDGAAASDPTGTSGTSAGQQSAQCPTGATPSAVPVPSSMPSLPAYPSGVGVCISRTTYDSAGQPIAVTLATAAGAQPAATARKITLGWTDDGLLAQRTAPSPTGTGTSTSTTRFDAVGRPLTQTDPLGHVSTSTWTADGLPAVQNLPGYTRQGDGAVSHRTVLTYDADGNTIGSTDALNQRTSSVYTADNLLAEIVAPGSTATSTLTTRYVHDAVGNVASVLSPSAVAKDPNNQAGAPTTYDYYDDDLLMASRQPVAVTETGVASTRRTTWVYDGGGRKTSQVAELLGSTLAVTASAGTQAFAYYPNSGLQTETGRRGETISYTYDGSGNPTRVADSTNTAADVVSTFYLDDLPRTVEDGTQSTGYAYDGGGQVLRRTQGPMGSTTPELTAYTYGDAGAPATAAATTVAQSTGTPWTWSHDAAGRLTRERAPNGQVTDWAYQPDGTLLDKSTRTGADSTAPLVARWTYKYDNLFRQTVAEHTARQPGATATKNQRHTFDAYDPAGRLTGWTDDAGSHTAAYDHNNNRVSVTTSSKPTQTTAYNADDSIKSSTDGAGGPALPSSYDPAGNLTNDGCYTYGYDGFDRTTRANPDQGRCATAPARADTSYSYDGMDRQRSRTQTTTSTTVTLYTDGTSTRQSSTATATTALSHDGLTGQVVAETSTPAGGAPDPAARYTLHPGGQPLGLTSKSPATTEYLTDDGHGNTTTITSENAADPSKAVTCATRFDPWGTPRTDSTLGSATATDNAPPTSSSTGARTATTGAGIGLAPHPCQTSVTDGSASTMVDVFYRGERRDTGTGNYQLGSRTYDPAKAAFLSHDTYRQASPDADLALGTDPLTRNRYAYVNGDPVNYADPTGHEPRPRCAGGCGYEVYAQESGSNRSMRSASPKPTPKAEPKPSFMDRVKGSVSRQAKDVYNVVAGSGAGVVHVVSDLGGFALRYGPQGQLLRQTGAMDAIDRRREQFEDDFVRFQREHLGVDTDSLAYKAGDKTTQVASAFIPVAGQVGRAGAVVQRAKPVAAAAVQGLGRAKAAVASAASRAQAAVGGRLAVGGAERGSFGVGSEAAGAARSASMASNTTRTGVTRTNPADWRATRDSWQEAGYDILSPDNLKRVAQGRAPRVDDDWVRWFPGDEALRGERISMHHVGGQGLTVPLPASRHLGAHMPGGYRNNPGGPGATG